MESLFVEPVGKFVSPWGLTGMGEGPIDGVSVEIAHEEHRYGLVKFRGEDVWDGMMARFIAGDLMVDINEMQGLIANYDIDHHGGWGCYWVREVVDNGDRLV